MNLSWVQSELQLHMNIWAQAGHSGQRSVLFGALTRAASLIVSFDFPQREQRLGRGPGASPVTSAVLGRDQ